MAHKAPGKHYRKGLSLSELMLKFPDDESARKWIEGIVWPNGPRCPHCGTSNVQSGIKHKSMTHRCRECTGNPRFSVRVNSILQNSRLGYRVWAIAAYLVTTNLKGVSSMKLHRDLGITQKSAWYVLNRIRKAYELGLPLFSGPVEADETYVGGLEKNKHESKKLKAGKGGVGKAIVAGVKDRPTNKVTAKVVPDTKAKTLQGFVTDLTEPDSWVFTDDHPSYIGIDRSHDSVSHSDGEYVKGDVHTQGMESFWAMLERGHKGVYHKFSKKHLHRYITEYAGRHNDRHLDTEKQMENIMRGMVGKHLPYARLIEDNGLDNGARS